MVSDGILFFFALVNGYNQWMSEGSL